MPATIEIYTKASCPYCEWTKKLLANKNATWQEIRIDLEKDALANMLQRSGGRRTVPQIFINNKLIGGFDDLSALDKAGGLDSLLNPDKET